MIFLDPHPTQCMLDIVIRDARKLKASEFQNKHSDYIECLNVNIVDYNKEDYIVIYHGHDGDVEFRFYDGDLESFQTWYFSRIHTYDIYD